MSVANRQNSLLVNQDWTRIYQTFKSADFTSYDFETLRKSMLDYLRLMYPEDFNDFIESSEYIALIDLIAFLGQSLAYRTDINARENFFDTAERRDSILKLARLISYNPKRNISAAGFLKFTSVTSSEFLTDSNGLNLANTPITWNDSTNANWYEQFSIILNASLISSQTVGKSGNSQVINSIRNDEYSINITTGHMPTFPFTSTVQNTGMNFEAVSATSVGQPYIYEVDPKPISKFNILYRNDSQGNGSNNTGFFLYFKQGTMQSVDFNIVDAIPNRVLSVGFNNINDADTWLYDLTTQLIENNLWTNVPAVAGINVIYNHLAARNLFQVNTTAGDQVDLVFGDGSFANIPQGNFRFFLRTSNGLTYKITPDEMQNVSISIPYVSRNGNVETVTVRASLNYTVSNATAAETINDIRQKAPQQYYTQGRMITGEDYNIVPYTSFSDILKVKALNRTSSGVSRYIDVSDTSGKYSSTNIFGEDGYLYSKEELLPLTFTYSTTANIQQLLQDNLTTMLSSKEMQHFYYANVSRTPLLGMTYIPATLTTTATYTNVQWHSSTAQTNAVTGYYYYDFNGDIAQIGSATSLATRSITPGSLVKFAATTNQLTNPAYFNAQNIITAGHPKLSGDRQYIYSTVMQVIGDGTNGNAGNFTSGQGPVTMSTAIPPGSYIVEVIPTFANSIPTRSSDDTTVATLPALVTKILAFNNFALRYDLPTLTWKIVLAPNVSDAAFSYSTPGSSWLIRFDYSPANGYTISQRSLRYVFGSLLETTFYFDNKVKVYDSSTGQTIQDLINILKVNAPPITPTPTTLSLGIDYNWTIYNNIIDSDGFEDQHNVLVTFTDTNSDGVPDNPDVFNTIIGQLVDNTASPIPTSLMFLAQNTGYGGFISYVPMSSALVVTDYAVRDSIIPKMKLYLDGQVFFATSPTDHNFYKLTVANGNYSLSRVFNYQAYFGRQGLYFQYRHNSPNYRRIDPSSNNIIDLYLLTNAYATDYTNWIRDTTNTISEPIPPTTDELSLSYSTLNNVKAISDSIIFNSAVFKPLFGSKATPALQATFKVVKNPSINVSDNDIKTSVISAINTYFATSNWDFGETFYFSELSAYLHSALAPNISSIVIVPVASSATFGSLYQINSESNEIMTSAATVDNVEIISAITAAQINASLATSTSVVLGTIR